MDQMDLNGRREQPDATVQVGEGHRFRVINIAPAGRISAWLTLDGIIMPITLHAKDGADLPPHQRVPVDRLPHLGVGETADFTLHVDADRTGDVRAPRGPRDGPGGESDAAVGGAPALGGHRSQRAN
jgi:hypothetical protein